MRTKRVRGAVFKVGWGLYSTVHKWLRSNYGAPTVCEGNDCSGKSSRIHYALIRGKKYEKKRGNFLQLCSSCHSKYDFTETTRKKMIANRTGVPRPELWKAVTVGLVNGQKKEFESLTSCANHFGVGVNMLGNYIARKYKFRGMAVSYTKPSRSSKKRGGR